MHAVFVRQVTKFSFNCSLFEINLTNLVSVFLISAVFTVCRLSVLSIPFS